jgi:lipoprotein-releasing system permease protein
MTEPDAAIAPAAAAVLAFERMVAWRYLRSRRKEGVHFGDRGFSFVGIMLGCGHADHRDGGDERVSGRTDHPNPRVSTGTWWSSRSTGRSTITRRWPTRFKTVDGCVNAIPLVEGQTLASALAALGTGALVRGIRAEDLQSMTRSSDNSSGDLVGFTRRGGGACRLAHGAVARVGAGDMITLVAPEGDVTPFGVAPRVKAYPIVRHLRSRHVGV